MIPLDQHISTTRVCWEVFFVNCDTSRGLDLPVEIAEDITSDVISILAWIEKTLLELLRDSGRIEAFEQYRATKAQFSKNNSYSSTGSSRVESKVF